MEYRKFLNDRQSQEQPPNGGRLTDMVSAGKNISQQDRRLQEAGSALKGKNVLSPTYRQDMEYYLRMKGFSKEQVDETLQKIVDPQIKKAQQENLINQYNAMMKSTNTAGADEALAKLAEINPMIAQVIANRMPSAKDVWNVQNQIDAAKVANDNKLRAMDINHRYKGEDNKQQFDLTWKTDDHRGGIQKNLQNNQGRIQSILRQQEAVNKAREAAIQRQFRLEHPEAFSKSGSKNEKASPAWYNQLQTSFDKAYRAVTNGNAEDSAAVVDEYIDTMNDLASKGKLDSEDYGVFNSLGYVLNFLRSKKAGNDEDNAAKYFQAIPGYIREQYLPGY